MGIAECNYPVARNIQKIIDEKGLKQKKLAVKANFTPNAFNSMLRGRKLIKHCDVNNIARALGVSVDELYMEEGE